ncbi:MAG: hypothetical protein LUC93_07570 [Planctomycetaceae bacterium]|nr:hypothetical protein [Planctomycetaceae bacterium]
MRRLLLALPLASLIFAAGCNTCNTCTTVADASVSTEIVTAGVKSGDVLTMEQYQALLAKGKVTALPAHENVATAPVKAAPAVAVAEKKAETVVAPVVKEEKAAAPKVIAQKPAVRQAAPARRNVPTVRTIPSMPLPEGWSYIIEEDLTGGQLHPEAAQMFYTQAPVKAQAEG